MCGGVSAQGLGDVDPPARRSLVTVTKHTARSSICSLHTQTDRARISLHEESAHSLSVLDVDGRKEMTNTRTHSTSCTLLHKYALHCLLRTWYLVHVDVLLENDCVMQRQRYALVCCSPVYCLLLRLDSRTSYEVTIYVGV